MENKICVYTVCRNESKRVDKWVDSMSKADRIVAYVHDCTDDTEQKLKDRGVTVRYGNIEHWRFDLGKNLALQAARELAPECNILVYTALDELWENDGWADIVRANWKEDTTGCRYKFVQSHYADGSDQLVSPFEWMHSNSPNWFWKYQIHELLMNNVDEYHTIDLFDQLKLEHWPDYSIGHSYLQLHKERYEEYKDDISRMFYVRELKFYGHFDEALKVIEEVSDDSEQLNIHDKAYAHVMKGDCLWALNEPYKALEEYINAIKLLPDYRDPFVKLGNLLCDLHLYAEAEHWLKKGLRDSVRSYDWNEDPGYWSLPEIYTWLCVSTFYQNKFVEALGYATKALSLNPNDEICKYNYNLCLETPENKLI